MKHKLLLLIAVLASLLLTGCAELQRLAQDPWTRRTVGAVAVPPVRQQLSEARAALSKAQLSPEVREALAAALDLASRELALVDEWLAGKVADRELAQRSFNTAAREIALVWSRIQDANKAKGSP